MVDVSRGLLVVCAVLDSLQFSTLVSKCKLHGDRYHFCQFGNGKSCFCFMMVLYVPTRKWFRWMSFWEQLQIFSGWDSCCYSTLSLCASTVPAWSENKRFSVVFFLEIWQLFRIWRVIIICSLWKSSFLGYASFSDTHMSDKRRVNGRLWKREEMRVQDNVKKRVEVWKNIPASMCPSLDLNGYPLSCQWKISIDVPIRNGPLSSPGVEYGLIVMIQLAGCLLSVILAHLVQCVQWQVESHAI